MATNTPNYNLTKPDLEDFADIRVLNANMDIIDNALKTAQDTAENIDLSNYATKPELKNYLPLVGGNLTGPLTINDESVIVDKTTTLGAGSGYTKLSNGLVIQWGYVETTVNAGSTQHVTLQTPMSTDYAVLLTKSNYNLGNTNTGGEDWQLSFNCTSTGFDIICEQQRFARRIFWLVIGG